MDMELEVFQRFKPNLVTAISDSVLKVAGKCQARGLIKGTYEKIVHNERQTPTERATLLVDAVDKCITIDCDNFEVFIGILDAELPSACKKPLSEMRELLKSLRDRRTLRLCTDDKIMARNNSVVDVPTSSYSPFKITVVSKQERQKDFTKPGRSTSSKTLAYSNSTDSGISIEQSDSMASEDSLVKLNSTQSEDLSPIEETPLDNNHQSSGATSTAFPPVISSKLSDKMWSVVQDIKSLRDETMQKEAVELSLREDIKQLRDELNRTDRGKWEAENELRIKRRQVADLTSAVKCERIKLDEKTDEVDGLESQIADGEASREKLAKQVRDFNRKLWKQKSKYKDDILTYELEATNLTAAIEEKERIICNLRSRMRVRDTAFIQTIREKAVAKQQLKEANFKLAEFERQDLVMFDLWKEWSTLKNVIHELQKEIRTLKLDEELAEEERTAAEARHDKCARKLVCERWQSILLQNENTQLKRQLSESATESLAKRSKTD
jgi:hypothetical protein